MTELQVSVLHFRLEFRLNETSTLKLQVGIERDFSSHVIDQFTVYWNVPTGGCKKWNINFEDLLAKYNIVGNDRDKFRGENINILYDPGEFPIVIEDSSGQKTLQNGGIPQEGDLKLHLKKLEKDIDKLVDASFSGLGIIDFEVWRPLYAQNWNKQVVYRNMSLDLAKKNNPTALSKKILEIVRQTPILTAASKEFGKAAKSFMLHTIMKFKEKRPNAKWGYYGFPYCFNYRVKMTPECPDNAVKQNDDESTAFYPSLYHTTTLSAEDRRQFMIGALNEAFRVSSKVGYPPIYPYLWFNYKEETSFLSEEDMYNSFEIPRQYKMGGAIMWGKSTDCNTEEKCTKLYKYVEDVMGPCLIRSLQNGTTDKNATETTTTTEVSSSSVTIDQDITTTVTQIPEKSTTSTMVPEETDVTRAPLKKRFLKLIRALILKYPLLNLLKLKRFLIEKILKKSEKLVQLKNKFRRNSSIS
ncbi:hypothetical protein RUM43_001626 [Polyplax serrata]|uniref:Hyaluronidase n=1 Tax=Polyplax serrata TaxID=468196 RepID=A0AAN8SJW0_POLSC